MTPYTASIHRSLLKHHVFMGNFDDIDSEGTVESLTSEQIKGYLLVFIRNEDTWHDRAQIREAMEGLTFPTEFTDPASRITTYCADKFERLDAIDYGSFQV